MNDSLSTNKKRSKKQKDSVPPRMESIERISFTGSTGHWATLQIRNGQFITKGKDTLCISEISVSLNMNLFVKIVNLRINRKDQIERTTSKQNLRTTLWTQRTSDVFLNWFVTSYFCDFCKNVPALVLRSAVEFCYLWLERLELSCWNFGGFLYLRFALKLWFPSDLYFFSWNMEFEQVRKVVHWTCSNSVREDIHLWECDTFCGMSPTKLLIFSSPRRISSRSYWRSTEYLPVPYC
jgi:hypothetical protein